jgi:hypothetical protein
VSARSLHFRTRTRPLDGVEQRDHVGVSVAEPDGFAQQLERAFGERERAAGGGGGLAGAAEAVEYVADRGVGGEVALRELGRPDADVVAAELAVGDDLGDLGAIQAVGVGEAHHLGQGGDAVHEEDVGGELGEGAVGHGAAVDGLLRQRGEERRHLGHGRGLAGEHGDEGAGLGRLAAAGDGRLDEAGAGGAEILLEPGGIAR